LSVVVFGRIVRNDIKTACREWSVRADENRGGSMSALGQKQTFAPQKVMSALPPIADMCGATRYVRYVPIADIRGWSAGVRFQPMRLLRKRLGARQNNRNFGELARLCLDLY
jgi:hypothetical protein